MAMKEQLKAGLEGVAFVWGIMVAGAACTGIAWGSAQLLLPWVPEIVGVLIAIVAMMTVAGWFMVPRSGR